MENKNGKIDNITAVLMIGVALLIDSIQLVLTIFGIGLFINWLISILAWLTFFLWFVLNGVSFMKKPKLFFTLSGGGLVETIPILPLSALPGWTATIITIIFMTKVKSKIKKAIS